MDAPYYYDCKKYRHHVIKCGRLNLEVILYGTLAG